MRSGRLRQRCAGAPRLWRALVAAGAEPEPEVWPALEPFARHRLVNLLIAVLTLLLLAVVMLVLSAPLRAARRQPEGSSADLDELHAAREAKYREIRDAELDYRTGKLSREDLQAIDSALRAEALDILNRLRELGEGDPESGPGALQENDRVDRE